MNAKRKMKEKWKRKMEKHFYMSALTVKLTKGLQSFAAAFHALEKNAVLTTVRMIFLSYLKNKPAFD